MALVLCWSATRGVLGGAERVLLEFATALEGEICLACPEGALARCGARRRASRCCRCATRRSSVRRARLGSAAARARLVAHAAEVRRLARDLDPDLVIACGMRSALACCSGARVGAPVVFVHHDMLPGPFVGAPCGRPRGASGARGRSVACGRATTSIAARIAARLVVHPGVDVDRFDAGRLPAQRPARGPRARCDGRLEAARSRARGVRGGAPVAARAAAADRRRAARSRAAKRCWLAPARARDAPGSRRRGRVRGAGERPARRSSRARAACCTAREREPFGIAVAEALACRASGRRSRRRRARRRSSTSRAACCTRPATATARRPSALVERARRIRRAARRRMGAARSPRGRASSSALARRARPQFAAAVARQRCRRAAGACRRGRAGRSRCVTVTHNSARGAARAAAPRSSATSRARASSSSTAPRATTAFEVARGLESRDVIALAENVGFGRGVQPRARARSTSRSRRSSIPTSSCSTTRCWRSRRRRWRARSAGAPAGAARPRSATARARTRSIRARCRSPTSSGAVIPPAAAARARRAPRSRRGERTAPRQVGLGGRRARSWRAPRRCARLGPFDERIFLYGEDLDLGLARCRARGADVVLALGARAAPLARMRPAPRSAASRSSGWRGPATTWSRAGSGPARARLDDAAQALTFTSRIAVKRALGRFGRARAPPAARRSRRPAR